MSTGLEGLILVRASQLAVDRHLGLTGLARMGDLTLSPSYLGRRL